MSLIDKFHFHIDALNKVSNLTKKIVQDLKSRKVEEALNDISNRDRLLNIVFTIHDSLQDAYLINQQKDDHLTKIFKRWNIEINKWSNEQVELNSLIEKELYAIKAETKFEIATIFDKKSRHKGYDLNNLK